jgi:predicted flap endonuclease-1-like 5' DNA nuclease
MISPPRDQPVANIARVKSNGESVANPRVPYQVFCIPASDKLMQDPNTTEDFRDLIGKIRPNTVLYRMHAKSSKDGHWIPIGSIKTTSNFVISEFDDRVLSFHHTRVVAPEEGASLSPYVPPNAPPSAQPPSSPASTQAAAHAPRGTPKQHDYLRRIEGIGPKVSSVLLEAGISTYSQLASTRVEDLKQILARAGVGAIVDPASWPEQAKLADAEDWDSLDQLQEKLRGGRRTGHSNV